MLASLAKQKLENIQFLPIAITKAVEKCFHNLYIGVQYYYWAGQDMKNVYCHVDTMTTWVYLYEDFVFSEPLALLLALLYIYHCSISTSCSLPPFLSSLSPTISSKQTIPLTDRQGFNPSPAILLLEHNRTLCINNERTFHVVTPGDVMRQEIGVLNINLHCCGLASWWVPSRKHPFPSWRVCVCVCVHV